MAQDIFKQEKIIMEASSGLIKENMEHTVDDTLKQIHSLRCVLREAVMNFKYAHLDTMLKYKGFGMQTVKSSITLSQAQLNPFDLKKFIYTELRTTKIPINSSEKNKRYKVFELLVLLLKELKGQEEVYQQLNDENDGAIAVNEEDRLINALK